MGYYNSGTKETFGLARGVLAGANKMNANEGIVEIILADFDSTIKLTTGGQWELRPLIIF